MIRKKSAAQLNAEISGALASAQTRAHSSIGQGLSDFHRANIPSYLWEELEADAAAGRVVIRKVERATKVTEGTSTTYYYRSVNFDQDLSVPSGYYGRWKGRDFSDDSLSSLLNQIDARPRDHASKSSKVLRLHKEPGGYTANWAGHAWHVFRVLSEYGDYQWIIDRDDQAPYEQADTLRAARQVIMAYGS
jgi:hypothetical protein